MAMQTIPAECRCVRAKGKWPVDNKYSPRSDVSCSHEVPAPPGLVEPQVNAIRTARETAVRLAVDDGQPAVGRRTGGEGGGGGG